MGTTVEARMGCVDGRVAQVSDLRPDFPAALRQPLLVLLHLANRMEVRERQNSHRIHPWVMVLIRFAHAHRAISSAPITDDRSDDEDDGDHQGKGD